MMNNKILIVVFDKHYRVLISSRNTRACRGDPDSEDKVEAALSELEIQNKEDVSLIHIMDVTTYREEHISLYVARLNGPDPVTEGRDCHLFWVPVQHLGVCSGMLSGGVGFEKMLKDYAISLVLDGYVRFPQ